MAENKDPGFGDILSKIDSITANIKNDVEEQQKLINSTRGEVKTIVDALLITLKEINNIIDELLKVKTKSTEEKEQLQKRLDEMKGSKANIEQALAALEKAQNEGDAAITNLLNSNPNYSKVEGVNILAKQIKERLDNNDIKPPSGPPPEFQRSSQGQGPTTGGRKSRRLGKKGKGKKSVKCGGAKKAKKGVKRTYKGGYVWGFGKKKTEKKLKKPKSKKQKSRKGLF